jgi:undecaprenyl pyrophosphate phosphatase UppP
MVANAKLLLSVTGVIEAATGLALLLAPALLLELLLGAEPDTPLGMTVARIAGAAVFALAVACWLTRDDVVGKAAKALVTAMLFYNFAVVAILVIQWLRHGISGIAFWPVVAAHIALGVWCLACGVASTRITDR